MPSLRISSSCELLSLSNFNDHHLRLEECNAFLDHALAVEAGGICRSVGTAVRSERSDSLECDSLGSVVSIFLPATTAF